MEYPRSAPALACLVTLAVSGCVFPGSADRPWHEEVDPAALLSALADVTARADNYTLDLGFGPAAPGGTEGPETLLTYEVSDSPAAVRATLSTAGDTDLVVVYPEDGEALLHDSEDRLGAPTEWVRGDALLPAPAPAEVFDLASLPDLVGLLAGMEGVERGTATGDGDAGSLPLNGVLPSTEDSTGIRERSAVAPLLGGDATGDLDVSVWVDAEGFPVRLESSGGGSALWLEFSDRNRTSFHVPNGDEVSRPSGTG